jgi:hypothetical protein
MMTAPRTCDNGGPTRIQGQGLALFDAAGASIAVLEVVYLR